MSDDTAVHAPTGIRYLHLRPGAGTAPVLLISGIGSALDFWRVPIAGGLMANREVLAFDLPGFGHSPVGGTGLTLDGLCTAAAHLVRDVVGRPGWVIGHSMGAYLAVAMAVRVPELVTEVVLVDGLIFTVDRFLHGDWQLARHLGLIVNLAAQLVGGGFPANARARRLLLASKLARRALLWSFMADPAAASTAELEIALANSGSLSTWRVLRGVPGTPRLESLIRAAARPVSSVYGGADHMLRKADLATFSELRPGAPNIGIPECGHWPMIEKPAAFRAALDLIMDARIIDTEP